MTHTELLENAFVNYLTTFSGWQAGLLIFPGENNIGKSGRRIVAYIPGGVMGDEDPPNSGNRWAEIEVELRTPFFRLTPSQIAAGTPDPLVTHQADAANLLSAITSSTLPDQLTAAQSGFTCFGLAERTPMEEQGDNFWISAWKIRLLSCPSTIAA